ncbi:2860_t:CDS:2 [Ambispora leptoticha]|uniref:2860_t:CDS:1 n=1 Tax=Ambispora leptoticha TaxID=144679 RepID=A0A9N9AR41_9GLOM|nr:2860_t:CDS:2 [Ambispora leptoticha]
MDEKVSKTEIITEWTPTEIIKEWTPTEIITEWTPSPQEAIQIGESLSLISSSLEEAQIDESLCLPFSLPQEAIQIDRLSSVTSATSTAIYNYDTNNFTTTLYNHRDSFSNAQNSYDDTFNELPFPTLFFFSENSNNNDNTNMNETTLSGSTSLKSNEINTSNDDNSLIDTPLTSFISLSLSQSQSLTQVFMSKYNSCQF